MNRVARTALMAIAAAGTLDILSAFVFGAVDGITPGLILRYIASAPFGDEMRKGGLGAALLGLGVHYAIMAVMVLTFMAAVRRLDTLRQYPVVAGALYGIALYIVMYWIVVPARFPASQPRLDAWSLGNALFSHIICVGIPMALIVCRRQAPRAALAT